ncbi:tyrosine-type recombinase/integrase [Alicyclobacillus sp. SO9]|uniref:tyrosine-type recombinase/integrase n=1 Tax=Alicyclobacillus sp. SO9 TaxID=2665646 RepID=UPI0018E855D2|nr:tyrosine-type recombinase/integrase [Alicyclobacillus sp. SO9]QQE81552.1 tyrosine-type recombinase/integrase [Alicyclobacillus sp. SO9]
MKNYCVEVVDRFREEQIEKGRSELTAKTYTNTLCKFNEWLLQNEGDINNLTRHDIQSYINHLDSIGRSASTIQKTFAALSVFARFLKRSDIIENIRVPEFRKQNNVAPKSLERNDKNRLLREIERDGNLRNISIAYMLLHTGLRISELCALDVEDVEIHERSGQVIVRHGKGNIARKVPLSAEARHHLSKYLESRGDKNTALFMSNERKRISVRTVQYMLSKHGVHPHQLRHTFCHDLVGSGVDISTVAELAGHSDINVTRRYSKPTQAELEKAIEQVFS